MIVTTAIHVLAVRVQLGVSCLSIIKIPRNAQRAPRPSALHRILRQPFCIRGENISFASLDPATTPEP